MIYCQPMGWVVGEMLAALALWSLAGWLVSREGRHMATCQVWRWGNRVLALAAAGVILYATLRRQPGEQCAVILTPFQSFREAEIQPELYRAMLMNVLLFLPLGLTLSNALPEKQPIWLRVILTVSVGAAFSCFIEWTQYLYCLGRTEVDDVLCNALGALLGALCLLWQKIGKKHGAVS